MRYPLKLIDLGSRFSNRDNVYTKYRLKCPSRNLKFDFQKQIGHAKMGPPETVLTCPVLPTYNYIQAHQKLNLPTKPPFKKMAKDASIHSFYGSHTVTRAQTYTREDVPGRLRHPSLAHNFHSNVRTIFLKSTDDC